MKDLFYLGMYAALKSDVIIGDKEFHTCESMLALITANIDVYIIPSIMATGTTKERDEECVVH